MVDRHTWRQMNPRLCSKTTARVWGSLTRIVGQHRISNEIMWGRKIRKSVILAFFGLQIYKSQNMQTSANDYFGIRVEYRTLTRSRWQPTQIISDAFM